MPLPFVALVGLLPGLVVEVPEAALLILWILAALTAHWVVPAYVASLGLDNPGKQRNGIRVVTADERPMTFRRALLRQVVRDLAAIPNLIWVVFDRRKQGLHDKVARTLVVRTSAAGAQARAATRRTPAARPAEGCPTCGFSLGPDGSCRVCGARVGAAA